MHSKGFTLIELLVVVSIVGVLSGIGMVVYSQVQVTARDAARKSDLKQIQIALELSYEKKGEYPTGQGRDGICVDIDEEFKDKLLGYLKETPKDPKTGNKYCYKADDKGKEYLLIAQLESKEDKDVLTAQKEACQNDVSKCLYVLASDDSYIAQVTPAFPVPAGVGATGGCGVCITATSPGCGETVNGTNGCGNSCTKTGPACPGAPPPPAISSLIVFVTSNTYTGDLGGLIGADQKCKTLADNPSSLAPKGKLWRAWLSDSNTNAKDRISSGKYVRIDGQTIATSKADLLDGSIALPINLTENGETPNIEMNPQAGTLEAYPYVWTGTQGNGDKKINEDCGSWQPQSFDGVFGVVRGSGPQGNEWSYFSVGGNQCQSFRRHLYCFEQVSSQPNPGPGCLEGYQDFDNDTLTTGPAQYFCGVAELPFGYRSSASAAGDCYDMNPNAKPGQTQYFPQDRGDGSYDYDCDGSSIPQYPKVGESCASYPISTSSNCSNSFTGQACYTTGRVTTSADCGIDRSYTSNSPTVYQDDGSGCLHTLANRFRGKLPCR